MADGARNLRINPFIVAEDHLATGEKWEDWIEELEREMRFFKVSSTEDKRDALLIFGGPEIRRLDKCLPDTEESNPYINLKTKLTNYLAPKKNVHFARYIFLKTTPLPEESILSYTMRLRSKAKGCNFKDCDERILEQIIQTTEDKDLIRNVILKKWSLEQTLTEMQIIEQTEEQVKAMRIRGKGKIERVHRTRLDTETTERKHTSAACKYCGKIHLLRKDLCPAYGKKCAKCGKFYHFALACKSKEGYRNQQRIHHYTDSNVNRMFQTDEKSVEYENDCFIGDSILHLQGLQSRSAQVKKIVDTTQSLSRFKKHYSYKQSLDENRAIETCTKPESGQFVNAEYVQASSVTEIQDCFNLITCLKMQLKQAEALLHKQNEKQEENLWYQKRTKEDIQNLQSRICQKDDLMNILVSKLTKLSSEYDNLKENYAQLSQNISNQLSDKIDKEAKLSNEIPFILQHAQCDKVNIQDADEAEICEVDQRFNSQVHDQTEIQESRTVFEHVKKNKYKTKQENGKLLEVKQQLNDQLDMSSRAETQNTNYRRRTTGAISNRSDTMQPPDLGKNINSVEQTKTERRNHVRRERKLTDEFRVEFRDYILEYT